MIRSRGIAIGAAIACVAFGVSFGAQFVRPPSKGPPPTTSPEARAPGVDGARLEGRIAALERELEAARLRAAPAPAATAAAPVDEKARAAEAPPPREPKAPGQRFREVVDHYAAFHAGQPLDRSASARAAREAAATLNEANVAGSTAESVDCRTTVCRIEVGHADQAAQAYFVRHIPHRPPFDGAGFYHRVDDEGGQSRTVVYVAREGFEMPPPN
jgi:hypothetical protein